MPPASMSRDSISPMRIWTSLGSTACFTLRGSPACAASARSLRSTSRRNLLASRRIFEAAAGAGVRVVFASSSSVYGDAERYPTPEETARPRPFRRTGSRSSGASNSLTPMRRASGSTPSSSATSRSTGRASDPTWRSPASSTRLRSGSSFELYGDGLQSRSFTYVADGVEATIAAMERAAAGSFTTSAAARRRRCARRSRRSNECRAAPRPRREPFGGR